MLEERLFGALSRQIRLRQIHWREWFRRGRRSPQAQPRQPVVLGEEQGALRVLAFSAGGPDTAFGFGLIHALLVSQGAPPHIVVGNSAGALVGQALADVLQAGEGLTGEGEQMTARVGRFRALLERVQQAPEDFIQAGVPDFTEISARAGLEPLRVAVHREQERQDREEIALARFGLMTLINGLLGSRLKISTLTRLVRLALEVKALDEWCWPWLRRRTPRWAALLIERIARFIMKGFALVQIGLLLFGPLVGNAPLVARAVSAPFRQWLLQSWAPRLAAQMLALSRLRRVKQILFESPIRKLVRALAGLISYPVVAVGWACAPPVLLIWFGLHWLKLHVAPRSAISYRARALAFRAACLALMVLTFALAVTAYVHLTGFFDLGLASDTGQWVRTLALNVVLGGDELVVDCAKIALGIWAGVVAALFAFGLGDSFDELAARFLDGFSLRKDLLTSGVLRRLILRAFDPSYFGKPDLLATLNAEFGGPDKQATKQDRRYLWRSLWPASAAAQDGDPPRPDPILVAPVAANVGTGELETLGPHLSTVDALCAACALTPLFEPQRLPACAGSERTHWYIDGANIVREPLEAALELVKRLHLHGLGGEEARGRTEDPFADIRLADDLRYVELCVVASMPTQRLLNEERTRMRQDFNLPSDPVANGSAANPPAHAASAEAKPRPHSGTLYRLADFFAMQQAHASKDDRCLAMLRHGALKRAGGVFFCSGKSGSTKPEDWHVFAHLRAIEPPAPVQLLPGLLQCPDRPARRELLGRTIADGCRASLRTLFAREVEGIRWKTGFAACAALRDQLTKVRLPGAGANGESFPGLPEICSHCVFARNPNAGWHDRPVSHGPDAVFETAIPDWGKLPETPVEPPEKTCEQRPPIGTATRWPLPHHATGKPGDERPTVSLVFSGGVFRGVFQVGVMAALCQAKARPDLVAGASVGTIMAALAARIFTEPDEMRRRVRLLSVTAAFLAIDRLVLTDRFADFVRRFTLRAGAADFSLRDVDHLFRRYDHRSWERLSGQSRRVLAGLQRITYLDPLELLDLIGLHAPRAGGKFMERLLHYAQDFLDRSGIGSELLGAEPLEQLIHSLVLDGAPAEGAEFDYFLDPRLRATGAKPASLGGIQFLATVTNLTTGDLDVLSSLPMHGDRKTALGPGLLASSAFPGVFRPRWNWELRAGSSEPRQELVDGGITDNLPLIPTARFLYLASQTPEPCRITARPAGGPHLLFTASLEPRRRVLARDELERTVRCWLGLRKRADQLRYNVKLDRNDYTQREIRRIYRKLTTEDPSLPLEQRQHIEKNRRQFDLLDLHVSCVKPEWLCGTFAFHPMLGFQLERQAHSIAHGCARTLVHFAREQRADNVDEGRGSWTQHWWNPVKLHSGVEDKENSNLLKPRRCNEEGECCFQAGVKCPFSPAAIQEINEEGERIPTELAGVLARVYHGCGEPATHQAEPD